MSINQKQYQQLTEIGISLWQHRPEAFQDSSTSQSDFAKSPQYLEQSIESLATLSTQTFFTDLLLVFNLSIGEVTAKKDHLDLGLFNWFFYTEQDNTLAIHCSDNQLISPSIESIKKSHALKKQLWQTIATKLL